MIFRAPYADVDIPNTSLTSYVLQRIEPFSEKPAAGKILRRILVDQERARSVPIAGPNF